MTNFMSQYLQCVSYQFTNIVISNNFRPTTKKEPSMYQRLSAHLTSVELLSELRESANRISTSSTNDENAIPPKMTRSESITK